MLARFRPGDWRVRGTSTASSGSVSVYADTPDSPGATPIAGLPTCRSSRPSPETGSTFDGRLRTTPAVTPQRIWVQSSNGGVAGPFTVTN